MWASPGPSCCTTCSVGRLSSFPVLSASAAARRRDYTEGLHGSPGYLRPRLLLLVRLLKLTLKKHFQRAARGRNQIGFELVCPAAARTLAAHLRVGWQREISIKSSYKTTRDACRSLAP